MTTTVYMDPAVGGDGNTYSDDSNSQTGLGNGGHRVRFLPLISACVGLANYVKTQATAVSTAMASVLSAATTNGTSTTSLTVGTGTQTLTIQTGKALFGGQRIAIASTAAPSTNVMYGAITSYNSVSGALVVAVDIVKGTGTFAAWTVSVSAAASNTSGVASNRQVLTGGLASGGGDLSADRTITVTAASAADIWAGNSTKAATGAALIASGAFVPISDSSTVSWSAASGINVTLQLGATVGATRQIGAVTGLSDGEVIILELLEDATGNRGVTWGTMWSWGVSGVQTIGLAANAQTLVTAVYRASTGKLHIIGFWKSAA